MSQVNCWPFTEPRQCGAQTSLSRWVTIRKVEDIIVLWVTAMVGKGKGGGVLDIIVKLSDCSNGG